MSAEHNTVCECCVLHFASIQKPITIQVLKLEVLAKTAWADQGCGFIEAHRTASQKCHTLFYTSLYTLYSIPLSTYSFQYLSLHTLFYTSPYTLFSIPLSTHSILYLSLHTLFYTSLYTLYSIPLSTHSILYLSLHTLFYNSLYTLYSIPLSTHSILYLSLHTLFYISLYTLYSIPLSTHSILCLSLHTLLWTSLYTLNSIPLFTHSILYLSLHTQFYTSLYTLYSIPLSHTLFYTSLYTLYSIPFSISEISRKKITWTKKKQQLLMNDIQTSKSHQDLFCFLPRAARHIFGGWADRLCEAPSLQRRPEHWGGLGLPSATEIDTGLSRLPWQHCAALCFRYAGLQHTHDWWRHLG